MQVLNKTLMVSYNVHQIKSIKCSQNKMIRQNNQSSLMIKIKRNRNRMIKCKIIKTNFKKAIKHTIKNYIKTL